MRLRNRIGSLFVREPLGELQDGTQGEACGVFTWLAGIGEEVLNVGVVEQWPEGIAQQQIGVGAGTGGWPRRHVRGVAGSGAGTSYRCWAT